MPFAGSQLGTRYSYCSLLLPGTECVVMREDVACVRVARRIDKILDSVRLSDVVPLALGIRILESPQEESLGASTASAQFLQVLLRCFGACT